MSWRGSLLYTNHNGSSLDNCFGILACFRAVILMTVMLDMGKTIADLISYCLIPVIEWCRRSIGIAEEKKLTCQELLMLISIYDQTGTKRTVTEYYIGSTSQKKYYKGERVNLYVMESDWDDFDHWEVVSGGAVIDEPDNVVAQFIMPDNDVVVRPIYRFKAGDGT